MEFLAEYGFFLAKVVTIIVGSLLLLAGIMALASKEKEEHRNKITVKKINDNFKDMTETINKATMSKQELKAQHKEEKKNKKALAKKEKKKGKQLRKRIFVLNFHGDIKAQAVEHLRQEITAILTSANKQDEVLLLLESAGGMVHGYGLAASQLQRIREKGIPLTVCVDKVAASGGYMMACVANRILAAPFSIIGSVGVIAQLPNFNRLLKKHHIDFEQITAGEYKRTVTLFGENTKKGREKFQEELNIVHDLFKSHIASFRSQIDVDKIATGEHWMAKTALDLKLVDELMTSDDYLLNASKNCDLYEVKYLHKKGLIEKVFNQAEKTSNAILLKMASPRGFEPLLPP